MEKKISLPQELVDNINTLNNEFHSLKIKIASKCIEKEKIKKDLSYIDLDISRMVEESLSIEEDLQKICDGIIDEYGEGDLDISDGSFYKSI